MRVLLNKGRHYLLINQNTNKMPKYTRNKGKRWDKASKQALKKLAQDNTPTRVIGLKLGRTENSIYNMASELDISLSPTNQSPYNRRK